MRMFRSFSFVILAALALLFGPLAAAEPAPDGPGYVMPVDASDAPVPQHTQRSSHIESGIAVMLASTIDHVPRLA